jgi:D-alanyl-D-alanine carboxypeptidase/D-alanyl-D-alanine-endopeptidase (penicillin-binding protein 4)
VKRALALALILSAHAVAAKPALRHKHTATPPPAISPSHARVVIHGAERDAGGLDDTWRRQKDSELTLDERTAKKIEELLRTGALRYGTTALYVVDATSGQELFAVHPDDPLNPASNVKLISTAAALDVLGADYHYRTRLLGPSPTVDGTIKGDVYLLGNYDPTLTPGGVRALAASVAARGVHAISGGVVVGPDGDRDGMIRDPIEITVTATTAGKAPSISIDPAAPFVLVTDDATTAKGRRSAIKISDGASTDRDGHARWSVHLTGTIGRGKSATYTIWPDPSGELTAELFAADLAKEGVTLGGPVRVAELSSYATEAGADGWLPVELAAHESDPLAAIVAQVNKRSINWLADRVIMTAAAAKYGAAPTMSRALDAMYAWLHDHAGVERDALLVDTGSGLSHKTAFSARQIVAVLRAASGLSDPHAAAATAYLASLSVAGVDGTLRHRFMGSLRGKLHAKTGTLNGAIALSGFLDAAPGHTLAFALVTNGNPSGSHKQVRAAHEKLVSILAEYAKDIAASDPKAATPTTPPPAIGPWGDDPPPPASQSGDDDEDVDPDAEPAAIPGAPLAKP